MGRWPVAESVEESSPVLEEEQEDHLTKSVLYPAWSSDLVNKVILQLCICDAVLVIAVSLNNAPLVTVFERIICAQYYKTSDDAAGILTNLLCKAEPIQHELALLKGWKSTLGQLPGVLLALPFGLAIDRFGRRPFYILFVVGLFGSDTWIKLVCLLHDHLPLRLVWLSPIFELIGGGVNVGASVTYTMIADIVPEENRVGAFMKLAATELTAQTIAMLAAAVAMRTNVWIPLGLSSCLWLVAIALAFGLPETHPSKRSGRSPAPATHEGRVKMQEPSQESLSERLDHIRRACSVITQNPLILSMLIISMITVYVFHAWDFLLLYASKYYEWDYALASLFSVVRGLTILALTIFLVPMANTYIARHYNMTALSRDLKMAQISSLLSLLGFVLMALAFRPDILMLGVIVGSLGNGIMDMLNSIMTSLVPPTSVGLLYTVIAVFRSIGGIVAGPLIAEVFALGIRLGGFWLGLPYAIGAALYALTLLTLLIMSKSVAFSADLKEKDEESRADDETSSLLLDRSLTLPSQPNVPG